jgi:3-dehydroquinate synthase
MAVDKKARGATLRFIVLDGLAQPAILANPPEEMLAQAYAEVTSR